MTTRFWLRALYVWCFLLLLSNGYRLFKSHSPQPAPDQFVYNWQTNAAFIEGDSYRLAYRDLHADAEGVPVLLLHGNPMAGEAMRSFAKALGRTRRILIPDLPGLGNSGLNLKAYSAINQVSVLQAWLESLEVGEVHVVGYSQGTAAGLELVNQAPELVQSMTLLSGVGLQSEELLGSYELNQPIYATYYGLLWGLRWLTPHFGLLDIPVLSPTTAANFADTDLRRNQAILEALDLPTQILHSPTDRLVPYRAAKAHAELVPHAIFSAMPGGHMGIFSDVSAYAQKQLNFMHIVESGLGLWRDEPPDGPRNWQPGLQVEVPESIRSEQSAVVAGLLALIVFFSEDLACISGGILAAGGVLSLSAAILGCFGGIWLSDVLLYALGAIMGPAALKLKFMAKLANGARYEKLKQGYSKNGFRIVFITRFIPGSRVFAFVTAGVLRVGFFRFSVWLAIAAAIWTPILVTMAYLGGRPIIAWWHRIGLWAIPLILVAVLCMISLVKLIGQLASARGRHLLRGRWIRLTRWEFWPAWPIYLPVVLYGTYLALRYRSVFVWGACNPGMRPVSGLALESKLSILNALNPDTGHVAAFSGIGESNEVETRLAELEAFQAKLEAPWPIVLKPDIGQRGEGVAIIHSVASARQYLSENEGLVIAQRYIPGWEFGVFYMRHPDATKGKLFSITEKVLPELKGDGVRRLEDLILEDTRAVAMAEHYCRVNASQLERVPAEGESVQLVELGTHCRGAVFLDGNRYKSDALLDSLETVLETYPDFYFGRFDLRVPSAVALMRGEGYQILELNGVSSESTDIYDPKNSLFHAWSVLCHQWRQAFEIGAANRARGAAVPKFKEVWSVIQGHRERAPFEVDAHSRIESSVSLD